MTGGVDLHSHTTASDGTLPPRELVRAAARRGVRVLAVTDHDSTDGLAEAFDEAAKHPPLQIVPGLEINCDAPGAPGAAGSPAAADSEVHILGYYVDHEAAWFQDFLREQRAERAARVHRIAARLAELGMPIDPAEVFAIVKEGSPGRPHVARVMVNYGYVK
jgi:predicted metal-dependent phosphoesterase TrpH